MDAIDQLGGAASTRDIAEFLNLGVKQVSTKLGQAHNAGLVDREHVPARRGAGQSYIYRLTPTGERLLEGFRRLQASQARLGEEDKEVAEQAARWGPELGQLALLALGLLVLDELMKDD